MVKTNKIVVAVTGASGSIYAKLLLDKLMSMRDQYQALGIVFSENAKTVWETEMEEKSFDSYQANYYNKNDFSAPFASGSAQYNTMIIVPCSMGTLGRIAAGVSGDLIIRAAEVMLKERRKLILVLRETPYSLVHIRNMETITLSGGIICPATPSFYSRPQTIEQVISTVVDRVIDLAGLTIHPPRWGEHPPQLNT